MGDKQNLAKESQLALKQDKLIAGSNITIALDGKTISAANPTSVTVTPIYQAGTLVAAIVVNGNTTNIYAPAQHGDNSNQNLAASFSTSATYEEGDYVIYQENLYKCTTAITVAGAWDASKWMQVLITDEMGQGSGGDYANQNIANTYDITSTYDVGDYVIYDGLLYKCITAVETSGPFNATYWERCIVTNEMGGSSVSTLQDLDDVDITSPAQDDVLKWDDTTQKWVNGAGGYRLQPVIYSTEEREIGVWTDGKPLYQKTIQIGPMSKLNSWQSYNHNILNIDTIVMARGWMKDTTNNISYWYEIPQSRPNTSNGISIEVTDTTINYFHNWLDNITDSYVTLQYTKTTDQPGSGIWTPSGVKAVHYNENEQVIGTWIDGSTLYERTLYQDLSGQAERWYVYLDTLIDDINNYTIINFQGQLQFKEGSYIYAHIVPSPGGGGTCYITRNSGRWYLYYHCGNATCTWGYVTVTIRYVKKLLGQPSS